jgi:hypothetical protein
MVCWSIILVHFLQITNLSHSFFFICIYSSSLHVLSTSVFIIRRINCINVICGICHSMKVIVSCAEVITPLVTHIKAMFSHSSNALCTFLGVLWLGCSTVIWTELGVRLVGFFWRCSVIETSSSSRFQVSRNLYTLTMEADAVLETCFF